MSKRRQERMTVEVQRKLAQIIKIELKDPGIDFTTISITRVDLTNDLSHARVYISVLGDDKNRKDTMEALSRAKGYIRSELASSIQLKHAPELEFRSDKSIEDGFKITALLQEIENEDRKKSDGE